MSLISQKINGGKDTNIHTDNHFWNKTCNNIFSMSQNSNKRLLQDDSQNNGWNDIIVSDLKFLV